MLKSEKGHITLKGSPVALMDDLACAIRGVRDAMSEKVGEERAKTLIARSIELSLMTDEEVEAEVEKAMKEFERGLTATLMKAMLQDD